MDMEELVERAQSGDTDAFVELMESQMTNLYKAARAMLSQRGRRGGCHIRHDSDLLGKAGAAAGKAVFQNLDDQNPD